MQTVGVGQGLVLNRHADGGVEIGIAEDLPKKYQSNMFTSELGEPHTVNEFDVIEAKEVNVLSDRRLKENMVPLTDIVNEEDAIRMLHAMHVHRYHLRTSPSPTWCLGLMADEYQKTMSFVLGEQEECDDGAYKTINYNHVVMLLLLNAQLLEHRVRVLETELLSHRRLKCPSHGSTDIVAPNVVAGDG